VVIGLAAWHIPGVLCVDQHNLNAMLFQNVVQRDPVHARRLYGYCVDPAGPQPFRHLVQGSRPATEFPYRIFITIRRHRHKMTLITNVNTSGVGMNDRQSRIARRCARFIRPAFNRSKVDILLFAIPYSSSLIFQTGLGSACEKK
jgi:hypothetical protein